MTNTAGDERSNEERLSFLWIARAVVWVLYAYLVVVVVLLFTGFVLLLVGADPTSGFVEWIYRAVDRTMEPFRGIFGSPELGLDNDVDVQAVAETALFFAIIVYGVVALACKELIEWLTEHVRRSEPRADIDSAGDGVGR